MLKDGGADQQKLLENHLFPLYMIKHHDSWCRLARERGLNVAPERIVLVQGTIKASNWTLASFSDQSKKASFSLTARSGSLLSAGASVHKSLATHMTPETRDSQNLKRSTDSRPGLKHDCVFLYRYEIRRRSWLHRWHKEPEVLGISHEDDHVPGCFCAWPWCRHDRQSKSRSAQKPAETPKSDEEESCGRIPPGDNNGPESGGGRLNGAPANTSSTRAERTRTRVRDKYMLLT